jgi:dihydrofolate synthase/folylpolyglutamate synthase
MSYHEALQFLKESTGSTWKLGLERLQALLEVMDHPEQKLKYIHIAGTNGKGSTAIMLSSVLSAAGYKVGLFTSPYLEKVNEQIRLNGEIIGNEAFAKTCKKVREAMVQLPESEWPTEFERLTAVAFTYFSQEQCDIVVLETGLGGLTDATNVIPTCEVAVFTNIGLDHMDFLGSDVNAIATIKSGIIKDGCKVISYEQSNEVMEVLQQACIKANSEYTVAQFDKIATHEEHLSMQKFSYKEFEDISLPLIGEHQRKNAAVVIETVQALRSLGYKIPQEMVKRGLFQVNWPARLEILAKKPLVILDGGHNEQCIEELKKVLAKYVPDKKIIFVVGVMKDKDYKAMLAQLVPLAKEFITVQPENPRALSAITLAMAVHDLNAFATAESSVEDGIMAALEMASPSDVICIVGSLYMAAQVRNCFKI